jgi:hypothetical protein
VTLDPDPMTTGYTFAAALLADPSTDTAGLDAHPLTNEYRTCMAALLFTCGRQTGLVELGDAEAVEFMEGFVNALADREGLRDDAGPVRHRQDDPN